MTLPAVSKTTSLVLVLPISRTATQPVMASFQMKDLDKRRGDGAAVGIGGHSVLHIRPPALHHGMLCEVLHAVIVRALEIGEEDIGFGIEMNRIVSHALLADERLQIGPDRVVAATVFVRRAGVEKHLEGIALHIRAFLARLVARAQASRSIRSAGPR